MDEATQECAHHREPAERNMSKFYGLLTVKLRLLKDVDLPHAVLPDLNCTLHTRDAALAAALVYSAAEVIIDDTQGICLRWIMKALPDKLSWSLHYTPQDVQSSEASRFCLGR